MIAMDVPCARAVLRATLAALRNALPVLFDNAVDGRIPLGSAIGFCDQDRKVAGVVVDRPAIRDLLVRSVEISPSTFKAPFDIRCWYVVASLFHTHRYSSYRDLDTLKFQEHDLYAVSALSPTLQPVQVGQSAHGGLEGEVLSLRSQSIQLLQQDTRTRYLGC